MITSKVLAEERIHVRDAPTCPPGKNAGLHLGGVDFHDGRNGVVHVLLWEVEPASFAILVAATNSLDHTLHVHSYRVRNRKLRYFCFALR